MPRRAPPIATRADFDAGLRHAHDELTTLLAGAPTDPTFLVLHRQLEALVVWTADGRTPTHAERARLTMGLVAQRELSGDAPALAALIAALHGWLLGQADDGDDDGG